MPGSTCAATGTARSRNSPTPSPFRRQDGPGKLVKFANGLDAYIKSFPDDARSPGVQADAG